MEQTQLSVLILDGESDLSLSVVRCLGQIPGLTVHTLSTQKYVPNRFSRYLSTFHFVELGNSQERIDIIHNVIHSTQADIILPVAGAMRFASKHYSELVAISPVTPTPALELFDRVVDKWTLTQFLIDHQVPIPETILIDDVGNLEDRISALTTPLILKLTTGSAGQDIFAFDDPASLVTFLNSEKRGKGRYLVQSFIEGHDIRCGVLCRNGSILAYTIHEGVLGNARKFGSPAGIRFLKSQQVLEVAEKLIAKLKWTGIASVDFRYDRQEDAVKVLEINPRYWGSVVGALSAGVNFPYLACLSGLGIPFERPQYEDKVYLNSKATLQQSVRRLLGQSHLDFSFKDTRWKYGIIDPLSDFARVGRTIFSKFN